MGWEQLGKTKDRVPMLKSLLEITKMSMGHKKQGQLSTREVVKTIISAPVAQSVPSDAHLGSNVAFATLNLSEEALLEILGKGDPTMTLERIKAAVEVAKKSGKKKAGPS